MTDLTYRIVSATTEDRFGETGTLVEAIAVARNLAAEAWVGGPVAVEHNGLVVHQFALTPNGLVVDEVAGKSAGLLTGNAAGA